MPANFGSDNGSGAHQKIIDALSVAAQGTAPAYGQDPLTARVEHTLGELFEHEITVLFMATGTAANCVGLATLCSPFGGVYATRRPILRTMNPQRLNFSLMVRVNLRWEARLQSQISMSLDKLLRCLEREVFTQCSRP